MITETYTTLSTISNITHTMRTPELDFQIQLEQYQVNCYDPEKKSEPISYKKNMMITVVNNKCNDYIKKNYIKNDF